LKPRYILLIFVAIAFAQWFIPGSRGDRFYFVFGLMGLVYLLNTIYGSYFVQANYFVDMLHHGSREQNKIALTFDDGPQPGFTSQVLDILKQKQVPALFFLIGQNIKSNEQDLLRMSNEGHIVGNHSYSHNYWFSLKRANDMLADIKRCDEEIERVIAKKPKLFRPPYGVTNPMVANSIKQGNYTGIGWSLRSYDTSAKDAQKLLTKILAKVKNGDVILLHEWGPHTIEILPALIDKSRKLGFEFVRADELLGVEAYY